MPELPRICQAVKGAVFQIACAASPPPAWSWGTAFYISPFGHALTAHHNLTDAVLAGGSITAFTRGPAGGTSELSFTYLRMDGDRDRDIALLTPFNPSVSQIPCLRLGWLGQNRDRAARSRFWVGRAVVAGGFPLAGEGSRETVVSGTVSWTPLVEANEIQTNQIEARIERLRIEVRPADLERLRIRQNRAAELREAPCGISGGPVVDLTTGCAIGVLGAFLGVADGNNLLASEFYKEDGTGFAWPNGVDIKVLRRMRSSRMARNLIDRRLPWSRKIQIVFGMRGPPPQDVLGAMESCLQWPEGGVSPGQRLLSEAIICSLAAGKEPQASEALVRAARRATSSALREMIVRYCPLAWSEDLGIAGPGDSLRELLGAICQNPGTAERIWKAVDRQLEASPSRAEQLLCDAIGEEMPYAKLARACVARAATSQAAWLDACLRRSKPRETAVKAIGTWEPEEAVPLAKYLVERAATNKEMRLRALASLARVSLARVPSGHRLKKVAEEAIRALGARQHMPPEVVRAAAGLLHQ